MREILAADKTILSRRDDLLAALDKKVPGNLRRDYAPIKRAINLNVGEIFFVNESNKDATQNKVREILKSSGMQETRINFVIETFTKALEKIKIPEVVNETVAKSKINTVKAAAKKISLPEFKVEESPKIFKPEKTNENIIEETAQHFNKLQTQNYVESSPQEKKVIEQTSQHFDNLQNQNVSQTLQDDPPFLPHNNKSKIFTIKGRLNRKAYLIQSFKVIALFIIGAILSSVIIGIPILIAAAVGGIMVNIRRLHDLNKSAWWLLVSLIPYIDIAFSLYLLFAPGTKGYNKYGPDPLRE